MAYIQKRGKSYRIRVSCGYTETGRQITRSMTWTPPAGLNARQIEKELKRAAYEFESRADGKYISDGSVRLSEYAEKYLDFAADRLSPLTVRNYKNILDTHILPMIGHMRVKDITSAAVQDVVRRLTRGEAGRGIRASTVRTYIIPLKAVLAEAVREKILPENPAGGGRIVYPRQESAETAVLSKDALIEIFERLEQETPDNRLLVHLAIASGCRAGELSGLMWEDVDFESSVISIRRSAYVTDDKTAVFKDTKTRASARTIALPAYIIDMLRRWHTEQLEQSLRMGDLWIDRGVVFSDRFGGIRPPAYLAAWWGRFLERNDLPHIKFHALRHTSATLLVSSGANIKSISSRLGHTNITITNRYMHAVEEADRAAAEVFENLNEEVKADMA